MAKAVAKVLSLDFPETFQQCGLELSTCQENRPLTHNQERRPRCLALESALAVSVHRASIYSNPCGSSGETETKKSEDLVQSYAAQ